MDLSLLWRIIANLASHLCGFFLLSNSDLLPAPSSSPSRSSLSPSLSANLTQPLTAPQIRLISKTRSSSTSSQLFSASQEPQSTQRPAGSLTPLRLSGSARASSSSSPDRDRPACELAANALRLNGYLCFLSRDSGSSHSRLEILKNRPGQAELLTPQRSVSKFKLFDLIPAHSASYQSL